MYKFFKRQAQHCNKLQVQIHYYFFCPHTFQCLNIHLLGGIGIAKLGVGIKMHNGSRKQLMQSNIGMVLSLLVTTSLTWGGWPSFKGLTPLCKHCGTKYQTLLQK